MPMVFLRTNEYGRVTLRHNRPGDLSDEQKSDGTTVDSIPDQPDGDYQLYVVNGSPEWKEEVYQYEAQDDLDGYRTHLLEELKEKRHEVETRGISYNGNDFRSDRETRQSVVETLEYARAQESFSTKWKTPSGFVEVTEADLVAVRDKIASLRQDAFDNEAALATEITTAASIEELKSVDVEAGWP